MFVCSLLLLSLADLHGSVLRVFAQSRGVANREEMTLGLCLLFSEPPWSIHRKELVRKVDVKLFLHSKWGRVNPRGVCF